MKQFNAFFYKEFLEYKRTGRLLLLAILFCIFGMMNPLIAKLTPELIKLAADNLEGMGLNISNISVNADTSWTQFFKNMPIMLMIFTVMFGSVITGEVQKGTLINVITKGMKRRRIIAAKTAVMFILWTIGYAVSFFITYGYNEYFWGGCKMKNIVSAAFCFYLFGLWIVGTIFVSSAVFKSSAAVIFSAGGVYVLSYVLSFIPKIKKFLPTVLLNSAEILNGKLIFKDISSAVIVCSVLIILNIIFSITLFNKKHI